MKRLAIALTARPSWAKLETVVAQLREEARITVDLVAMAYALIHRFGSVMDICHPDTLLTSAVDGNTPESSAHTTALVTSSCASYFHLTRPDGVLVCADRHETLGVTIAASYQNIPILHMQGGETSGNIDNKVRWANSALSDWHACATSSARDGLVDLCSAMGRLRPSGGYCGRPLTWIPPHRVEWTGCPSIDVALAAQQTPPVTAEELSRYGTGTLVEPRQSFVLVMHHPDTSKPDQAEAEMREAISVASARGLPLIVMWPGADAGVTASSKYLRGLERAHEPMMHFVRTMPPTRFLRLLGQASYAVGNSSALIREASALGVPRVILGDRQRGRPYTQEASDLYGDGKATGRIVQMVYRMLGVETQ